MEVNTKPKTIKNLHPGSFPSNRGLVASGIFLYKEIIMITIKCKTCNKKFDIYPSDTQKFHSKKCWYKWLSKNIRGKNHYNWKNKIKITCKQCHKEFEVYPSDKDEFHSIECWYKWLSENTRGKNNPHWKGGKIWRICVWCGKEFKVYPSLKNKTKFCPRSKCFNKWHSENLSGKNSPMWLGGKSFEPYGVAFNKKLKEQMRIRDNYRCQQCFRHENELFTKSGKKRKLYIHHIDYNKRNNNPENLISLCINCHGQTNFSRKDWNKHFQERRKNEKIS